MRIGFDFDGVLSLTPFGRFAVHRPQHVPPLPENFEHLYESRDEPHALRVALEWLRFAWRRSAPDAPSVLRELSAAHTLFVVTGRSDDGISLVHRWMRRQGIESCFAGVHMAPPGLTSPQHKLATAKMLSLDVHIDDDPRTAFYLANSTSMRVFLLDHAGARGDVTPPANLTVVRTLGEFAAGVASAGEITA